MCSFSLTPVPFSDPLSLVKSVRILFTNRTELNRTGVTYPLCTVVLLILYLSHCDYVFNCCVASPVPEETANYLENVTKRYKSQNVNYLTLTDCSLGEQ